MRRKIPPVVWVAVPLACFLYFYHLSAAGLLGPDEPRYASVASEMARSGDWVTPRLWGEPWFEKPALLYWMTAAALRLGLGRELAPRLPVAVMGLVFLGFYWWILRREFGSATAWFSVFVLGTSAGYVAFSQVGVTDLPLTVTFSAAMLLALPWIAKGDARWLPAASALLGLAVLAKGLVPLVLALPLMLRARRVRDLLRWRVWLPFLLVALPWYALCSIRNGREFWYVFFWQHHFERFASTSLLHVQAWWFYLPVLVAGLLPWSPLLVRVAWAGHWRDPRRLFLGAWFLFGLVFFSAAENKLPGYILPLLPAAAALMGLALNEAPDPRPWLAACALLLIVYPVAAPILPDAVAAGISRAPRPAAGWTWVLPAVLAAAVFLPPFSRRRVAAAGAVAACAAAGLLYLKAVSLPQVDRIASARALWGAIAGRAGEVCIDDIRRDWRYGLNYYAGAPLPDCAEDPRPWVLRQDSGQQPRLLPASDRSARPSVLPPG